MYESLTQLHEMNTWCWAVWARMIRLRQDIAARNQHVARQLGLCYPREIILSFPKIWKWSYETVLLNIPNNIFQRV
jgi:hypothetical protein